MTATVLVLNCGSSSVKYELIAPRGDAPDAPDGIHIASGVVERIGEAHSRLEHRYGGDTIEREMPIETHAAALAAGLSCFDELGPPISEAGIVAVGHRVVMGGRHFPDPVIIDEEVMARVEQLGPLAPLHNPPNLIGITVARKALPGLMHVAVFDTAFFYDLPPVAASYALDPSIASEHGIRRYGFHGTSHHYVSQRAAEFLGRQDDAQFRQIVLHLGNGASASAVIGGRAVDTSMGFTPLEGLVMGTRTGDIDAAVVLHLTRNTDLRPEEIDDVLNRRSGMKGLAGFNDMRDIHRAIDGGDSVARFALDLYVYRIRKYIGAYAAAMGGLDALSFTAGVGENDPIVRAETAQGLEFLGITIDPIRNAQPNSGSAAEGDSAEEDVAVESEPAVQDAAVARGSVSGGAVSRRAARRISPDDGAVAVLVVPTDEEWAIAQQTMALLEGMSHTPRPMA